MTDGEPRSAIRRHIELTDSDIESVEDAVRVLAEPGDVRPHEMTPLFYAAQHDNLRLVVEDLLRIFDVED